MYIPVYMFFSRYKHEFLHETRWNKCNFSTKGLEARECGAGWARVGSSGDDKPTISIASVGVKWLSVVQCCKAHEGLWFGLGQTDYRKDLHHVCFSVLLVRLFLLRFQEMLRRCGTPEYFAPEVISYRPRSSDEKMMRHFNVASCGAKLCSSF